MPKDEKVTQLPTAANRRVVKLSRPLKTHHGDIAELTLEEPRAELLLKIGLPWRHIIFGSGNDQRIEVEYVPEKMVTYIEAMSGVDAISLEAMSARDMNNLFVIVMAMLSPGGSL